MNNGALFPNDINNINDETIGITEMVYTQFLSSEFGVFGGLLNTLDRDANELAGSARSASHFMNSVFLLSLVNLRTVPSVTLGGGMVFIPRDWILGAVTVMDTEESATLNPFNTGRGTTVGTEWNFKHKISNLRVS